MPASLSGGDACSSRRRAPGNIACKDGVQQDILCCLKFEAGDRRQSGMYIYSAVVGSGAHPELRW